MDIIGILVLVISFFFLLVVGVPVAYSIGAGQFRSVGDPVFYIGGEYHE